MNPSEDTARALVCAMDPARRSTMTRLLSDFATVKVVGFVRDYHSLQERIRVSQPALLIVDSDIHRALGDTWLELLRAQQPSLAVVVCSPSGKKENSKTTMPGVAYVSVADPTEDAAHKRRILQVLAFRKQPGHAITENAAPVVNQAAPARTTHARKPVKAVVIGVSTGGPEALTEVFREIDRQFPLPIAVVQHMPATFTKMLAERLDRICPLKVLEGSSNMPFLPGQVVIGPGGHHMTLQGPASSVSIQLNGEPPENSCRPAVDVLFRSAAEVYGPNVLAVVLTGMGRDGLAGAYKLSAMGAPILAQDAATSTVWGMPGAIAGAGLAHAVLPLSSIVPELMRYL